MVDDGDLVDDRPGSGKVNDRAAGLPVGLGSVGGLARIKELSHRVGSVCDRSPIAIKHSNPGCVLPVNMTEDSDLVRVVSKDSGRAVLASRALQLVPVLKTDGTDPHPRPPTVDVDRVRDLEE